MKKSTSALLLFCCLLCAGGCAPRASGSGSFDALSAAYGSDARIFAGHAAQELRRRYAPARTSVVLDRAPGVFGDTLEQALRADGFALTSSGLGVSYRLDTLESDRAPLLGYVQVACSDGQMFSFSREIFKGTEPPAPGGEAYSLKSRPLAESAPAQASPRPPAPAATPAIAGPGAPAPDPAPDVETYPVRRHGTAAAIARRNGLSVADFCAWNRVGPKDTLAKGRQVYLSQPPARAIPAAASGAAPVPPAVAEALSSAKAAGGAGPAAARPATMPTPGQSASTPFPPAAASAPAAPAAASVNPVAPASLPKPPPRWEIAKGRLRGQMDAWAAVAGYSLIWNADHDYEMRSASTFTGDFIDAVKHFFAALQTNGLALRVTIYQGNKVMEVSEH